MGYYQGDYYRGDYYRGDPGLFGFLGGIAKKGLGFAGKFLPGPLGGIATTLAGIGGQRRRPPPPMRRLQAPGRRTTMTGISLGGERGITVGRRQEYYGQIQGARVAMTEDGCCPSGYHPAKDGMGGCVKNRRMNVTNPRALRRSLRRVSGFAKTVKRTRKAIRAAEKAVG